MKALSQYTDKIHFLFRIGRGIYQDLYEKKKFPVSKNDGEAI